MIGFGRKYIDYRVLVDQQRGRGERERRRDRPKSDGEGGKFSATTPALDGQYDIELSM